MYCSLCEHDIKFHYYVKESKITICKVKNCKCLRHIPELLMYSQKLLEELK